MQRVTNCILRQGDQILMLQKPRRGWWTAPGGKMEPEETILSSIQREFFEETGLTLIDPQLRGVFTMIITDKGKTVDEWMLFTFYAEQASGTVLDFCAEGILSWQPVQQLQHLPTAEGDQLFLTAITDGQDFLIKKFIYTVEYELIAIE